MKRGLKLSVKDQSLVHPDLAATCPDEEGIETN